MNRLIAAEPNYPVAGSEKVAFAYDDQGRRIEKKAWQWYGFTWAGSPTLHRKFVYAGWRPVLELDGLDSDAVIRKYTWGLDLSRSLSGAAGIGGLLAIEDPDDPGDGSDPHVTAVVCYDAMGNVSQLVDLSGTYDVNDPDAILPARYEYTPYGQLRSSAGDYADENPLRFSSKYWDDETGLGYWGKRFYRVDDGRWQNRDPIGERGGKALFSAFNNSPVFFLDYRGLHSKEPPYPPEGSDNPGEDPCCTRPTSCECKYGDLGQAFCDAACASDKAHFYGISLCPFLSAGERCSCTCDDKINNDPRITDPTAQDILAQCASEHEAIHDIEDPDCQGTGGNPGAPGDCHANAYTATAYCMARNAENCNGNQQCLEQVLSLVSEDIHLGCGSDGPGCSMQAEYVIV